MTQEKFKQRADAAITRVKESHIDADLQDAFVELIEDARIATNGLTPEEKIQLMSENQFSMAILLVQNCITSMSGKVSEEQTGWKGVILKCKSEIMWILLALMLLIAFRPNLAETISTMFST